MPRRFLDSIHIVQQFQTGATFLKRIELFSRLVKNLIKRVENLLEVEARNNIQL